MLSSSQIEHDSSEGSGFEVDFFTISDKDLAVEPEEYALIEDGIDRELFATTPENYVLVIIIGPCVTVDEAGRRGSNLISVYPLVKTFLWSCGIIYAVALRHNDIVCGEIFNFCNIPVAFLASLDELLESLIGQVKQVINLRENASD